jgi:predicted MFS family arabinose efflux permease
MLSLLLVGISTNFWMALAGRAIGGFLNGNIGVIQVGQSGSVNYMLQQADFSRPWSES